MQQTHAHAPLSSTPTILPTGKLGLWWFLSSEIITFGGLMGSYMVLRLLHPEWAEAAQHLNVVIATVNTAVLLTSSLTMVLAFAAVEHADNRAVRTWLACTVTLGLVFLLIKAWEWSGKLSAGMVPGVSGFWSFYYAMTGLHALHVLGGIVVNAVLLLVALRGRLWPMAHRVELAGLYWHFVDLVWIFLFPLLYLS
jgi:heme/copper-type cytochrome/quinol oxidase subunit 3